jgi:hypothetical protein
MIAMRRLADDLANARSSQLQHLLGEPAVSLESFNVPGLEHVVLADPVHMREHRTPAAHLRL